MSTLNSPIDIDYLQVGNGRLGDIIAQQVRQSLSLELTDKSDIQFARIDTHAGLTDFTGVPLNGRINRLVICVSPGKSKSWQWQQLLLGLVEQKARGELKINRLVFISSTRIYDGIKEGVIAVDTPPNAQSERAKGLLLAENHIKQLADSYHILRCSGLYGGNYQKYSKILFSTEMNSEKDKQTDTKPRYGVHVENVAKAVVARLNDKLSRSSLSLLTDGYCYFKGRKVPIGEAQQLSSNHRLLLPGIQWIT